MRITVYGNPAPQGSKRHVGNGIMVESSKAVKPWREHVHHAALLARADDPPIDGAADVEITFYFNRPLSHYRTGRNAHLLRDTAPPYPTGKNVGDVDKLLRSSFDALASAGVFRDDSLVADVTARKRYCEPGTAPRAIICVTAMAAAA